jgi:hypothetical protein
MKDEPKYTRRSVLKGGGSLALFPLIPRRAPWTATGDGPDRSLLGGTGALAPRVDDAETDPESSPEFCDHEFETTDLHYEDDVLAALKRADRRRPVKFYHHVLDDRVTTTDRATMNSLLFSCDRTEQHEHIAEEYDCEDFAFDLRQQFVSRWGLNCVGVVIDYAANRDGGHAYNIVFYADGTFSLFEPQTDTFVSPNDGTDYRFRDVIVLI